MEIRAFPKGGAFFAWKNGNSLRSPVLSGDFYFYERSEVVRFSTSNARFKGVRPCLVEEGVAEGDE